jgi:hypothetical protein
MVYVVCYSGGRVVICRPSSPLDTARTNRVRRVREEETSSEGSMSLQPRPVGLACNQGDYTPRTDSSICSASDTCAGNLLHLSWRVKRPNCEYMTPCRDILIYDTEPGPVSECSCGSSNHSALWLATDKGARRPAHIFHFSLLDGFFRPV